MLYQIVFVFLMTIMFAIVLPSEAKTGDSSHPRQKSSDGFKFIGVDADKLSPGNRLVPDQIKDLHFQLIHEFPVGSVLVSAKIHQKGVKPPQVVWSSDATPGWGLVVEANGEPLNATKPWPVLGRLNGLVKLDFYAGNQDGNPFTTKGTTYVLELDIKGIKGERNQVVRDVQL